MNKHDLIKKWRRAAEEQMKMADALREDGNVSRSTTHTLISDTFRICADDLSKL